MDEHMSLLLEETKNRGFVLRRIRVTSLRETTAVPDEEEIKNEHSPLR